jgi:tRNA pseudouridine38-40 synthase
VPLRRIKLVIEYDGSCFHGWQIQNNANTVQEEIERAVYKITGEQTRVTGSGRTDAGVHAYGQVAHFDTNSNIPPVKFSDALNSALPSGIAIILSEEVSEDFHARFSATKKTYKYKILNRKARSPIMEKRAWHIKGMLNVDSMNEAARNFIGYHDFTAFCSSGHNITSFERNIYISQWTVDNEHLVYTVSGDGFLYNMVRIMTGTMVEVGMNKRAADSIFELFEKKDRNLSGITAPAHGLYLVEVNYEQDTRN